MGLFDFIEDAAKAVGRATLGVATFGQSEAVIYGAGKLKEALTPDTVNYQGGVLSKEDKEFLDKLDPATRQQFSSRWMFGLKPGMVDPGLTFARTTAFAPLFQKAGAGMGLGGLFGLGKVFGSGGTPPMQPGVPYSMPPMPNPFGGR